jgi:hypothetical protein
MCIARDRRVQIATVSAGDLQVAGVSIGVRAPGDAVTISMEDRRDERIARRDT